MADAMNCDRHVASFEIEDALEAQKPVSMGGDYPLDPVNDVVGAQGNTGCERETGNGSVVMRVGRGGKPVRQASGFRGSVVEIFRCYGRGEDRCIFVQRGKACTKPRGIGGDVSLGEDHEIGDRSLPHTLGFFCELPFALKGIDGRDDACD